MNIIHTLLLLFAACEPQPDLCTENAGGMPLYSRPCHPGERGLEDQAARWWVDKGPAATGALLHVQCTGSACSFFFQDGTPMTAACTSAGCTNIERGK